MTRFSPDFDTDRPLPSCLSFDVTVAAASVTVPSLTSEPDDFDAISASLPMRTAGRCAHRYDRTDDSISVRGSEEPAAVSYTHLTLPTTYTV